jgi:hypothetical protein
VGWGALMVDVQGSVQGSDMVLAVEDWEGRGSVSVHVEGIGVLLVVHMRQWLEAIGAFKVPLNWPIFCSH